MDQAVSFGNYRFDAGTGRLWSGRLEVRLTPKASAVLKMLVTHAGKPDRRALSLGSVHLMEVGQTARALEWSERSLALYPDDMSALVNGACLRARLGQKEGALELLERVFARGWGKLDWVAHDPDYDSLRGDPRFQRLVGKLK